MSFTFNLNKKDNIISFQGTVEKELRNLTEYAIIQIVREAIVKSILGDFSEQHKEEIVKLIDFGEIAKSIEVEYKKRALFIGTHDR